MPYNDSPKHMPYNDSPKQMSEQDARNFVKWIAKWVVRVVLLIVLLCMVSGGCYTIPAGKVGVLMTFGKVSMEPKVAGLHWKWPMFQGVEKMSVRTEKYESKAEASSVDLQSVTTVIAINYHLDTPRVPAIYKELGTDYAPKVIAPTEQEVIKATIAKYKAEELITKRELVKSNVDDLLRSRLAERGIVVEAVNITDFDFSAAFNQAIEVKVTTEQNALAAKNKLEQVKYEAEQQVAKAKGEAEAIAIQAKAIQTQGGESYIQLKAIERWDGKMPYYTGGAMPFIDVGRAIKAQP